jgi:hypothetical protein
MGHKAAENSIEAIKECYHAGGDAIDCDLRFTRDGVLVTVHDAKPKGWTRGISEMDWAESCTQDLEPHRYPGQTVPAFEDVVRHALANNLAIHLDPKVPGTREAALEILEKYSALHLIHWPLVPTVYNVYRHQRDDDAEYLKKFCGEVEGAMRPYYMSGCKTRTVHLKSGDPRHFRCDDPRTVVGLAGRTPEVIARVRGPYRDPLQRLEGSACDQ